MKYLIVLPAIDKKMTSACLETIDRNVLSNLLVIDNSSTGIRIDSTPDRMSFGENIGVGRSWNVGAKKVVRQKLDYLVLLSATMRFKRGMKDFIQAMGVNSDPWGLETQHAWHCIALRREVFEKIGLFDENFYPAYYEDSDFIRRMEIANIHMPLDPSRRIRKIKIAATDSGTAHGIKSGVVVNMGACREYFIEKWGFEPRYDNQENRDKLYTHPFDDATKSIDYWPKKSIKKLKRKYGLDG